MTNVSQIYGTLRDSQPYIILNSIETEVSGNLAVLQNLDVCGNVNITSELNVSNGSGGGTIRAYNYYLGSKPMISGTQQATFRDLELKNWDSGYPNYNKETLIANGHSGDVSMNGTLNVGTINHANGINIEGVTIQNNNVTMNGNLTLNNTDVSGKLTQIDASLVDLASNSGGAITLTNNNTIVSSNASSNAINHSQTNAVNIGVNAGDGLGNESVSIGINAGSINTLNSNGAVAIGTSAGYQNQGQHAIAIGRGCGTYEQGYSAVAIGNYSGRNNSGIHSVALGPTAGMDSLGENSVAIGFQAGLDSLAANSIAIGSFAGVNNNNNNSNYIVLNGTGSALDPQKSNAFFVKPIQNETNSNKLLYNSGTGEITYQTDAGGATEYIYLEKTTTNFSNNTSHQVIGGSANPLVTISQNQSWFGGFANNGSFTFTTGGVYRIKTNILVVKTSAIPGGQGFWSAIEVNNGTSPPPDYANMIKYHAITIKNTSSGSTCLVFSHTIPMEHIFVATANVPYLIYVYGGGSTYYVQGGATMSETFVYIEKIA